MSLRQIKKLFSCILILCCFLGFLPVNAYAASQSELEELRAQRDELSAQREEKQAVVDELEEQQASVLERKQAMDERNMYTIQEMQNISEEIALYDDMISEKADEVAEAKRQEDAQLERYRARVRSMEEVGDLGFLALVLNTSDFGEFLTAIDDVGEIMKSDREMEDKLIAAREKTEQAQAEYEAVRKELGDKQEELRLEQELLEMEIEEASQLIQELMEDIEANSAELAEISAAEDEADARIAEMVAQLTSRSGGGGGGGGTATGTGSFSWPASSNYCTSRFGERTHPVTGERKNHNGLDIGAGYGSAVTAADSGTVTLAGVNGGYGNCVMIDHGNGYVTLYGHLSSIIVSEGESVSQGQVIGYVGDTGITTGPHLHFEVRTGGGGVDPEQFFSGLTFSPDAGE